MLNPGSVEDRILRFVHGCLTGGLLLLVLGTGIFAQEPPLRFRVSSNLILVDVRVRDSQGRPITGLRVEDFSIWEEGVLQKISYFQEIALPLTDSPVVPSETTSAPTRVAADSSLPVAPEKRLLILLFNLSSAGLQDIQMMGRAAQQFLE